MIAVYCDCFQGAILYTISKWTFVFFLGAADCGLLCGLPSEKATLTVTAVVMILRVWAMYNRSRLILRTLLMLFSVVTMFTVLGAVIYSDLTIFSGTLTLAK